MERIVGAGTDFPAAFVLTIHLAGMEFAAGMILVLVALLSSSLAFFFQNF